MAGYTRQSTYADGDIITAADSNNEFNQVLAAFVNTSGHKHDGTAAEGPVIGLIGDPGVATPLNKVVVDDTNNRIGVFVDAGGAGSTVEQLRFQDGAILPVTTNDVDIGSSSLKFKELHLAGAANIAGTMTLSGNVIVSGTLGADLIPDGDNTRDIGSSSAEWKDLYIDGVAYVDAINLDGTAISATAAELNIMDGVTSTTAELNILDGVTSTAAELNILDGVTSTTAELNILDGVTATTAELNLTDGGSTVGTTAVAGSDGILTNDGGTMRQTSVDTFDTYLAQSTKTLTNKTLTSAVLNGTISGTSIKDEDNMASDSATHLATQQSIKAYVDAEVAAIPVGDITAVTAGTGMTGGGTSGAVTLNVIGGAGITANANDIAVDSTVITGQTAESTVDASNDLLLMYDNSATALRKVAVSAIVAASSGISAVVDDTSPELGGDLDVLARDIVSSSNRDIDILPNGSGKVNIDGNGSSGGVTISDGLVDIRTGTGSVSQVKFYCESSNAHAQTIQPQAHGQQASNTLTLPGGNTIGNADAVLVSDAGTQTLTNKSLTAPVLTGSSSAAGSILFKEDTDNGTNAVTLIGPAATADVTLTLPAATDTLVGKATTDTLTNKSIDASQLTGTVANARLDAQLQDVAGLAVTDGGFIVGDGSNFVLETAGTARTSLGLGTAAVLNTGTSAGNAIVLDGSARLPGVDGAQVTNLPSAGATAGFAVAMAIAL